MARPTDMRVGVITYQRPHRKTYDVLCRLKAGGYEDVSVWALPLSYEKKSLPAVAHRPDMWHLVPGTDSACTAFGFRYEEVSSFDCVEAGTDEPLLVCGAGIIPRCFVESHLIVNAHPGYIPYARGLDSLKWAVLEGLPIGVSTHVIGDEVDAGEVIERRLVEVRANDSFFELGVRVYETEVEMLVDALARLDGPRERIPGGGYEVRRRMPAALEPEMLSAFEALKTRAIDGTDARMARMLVES